MRRESPRGRMLLASVASLFFAGAGFAPTEQAQEVVVSQGGFRPDVLNARKGEALRLRVTTSDQEHCFAIDGLRVEKRVVPGRVTTVEVTPDRAGTFDLHCCLHPGDKETGRLVVGE